MIGNDDPLVSFQEELRERLLRIESTLELLVHRRDTREWYTTEEAAVLLGKAPFTVREWCRLGRVRAEKRACGRGKAQEWMISAGELGRVRDEGLLPDPGRYRHVQ